MNKFVFYIFLITIGFNLKAQGNLVPNGSFEILSDCPFDAILVDKANGWFSPSNATPDIYNVCSDFSFNNSVPLNGLGFQYAKEGNGYIGIVPHGKGNDYREYVGCQLSKTLEASRLYEASYYVNLASSSPIACNNFGIGFASDSVHINTTTEIYLGSILESDIVVTDTTNWTKITFYFEAKGDENYIFLGNFRSDIDTKTITYSNSAQDCYYFVDLVTLVLVEFTNENCFTPNGDGINDLAFKNTNISESFTVNIFNRWGAIVNSVKMKEGWDGTDFNHNALNNGVYFYQINFDNKKGLKNGFIHLIK